MAKANNREDRKYKMKGVCNVCCKVESKYKCPSCLILYCSLDCYKLHKETPCQKNSSNVKEEDKAEQMEEGEIEEDRAPNEIEDEDWVSPEKLQMLGDSKELKDQLGNKHLRELLLAIDSSPNPGEKLDEAMQIPIFTEFMDVCMKVIEGKDEMS